MRWVGFCSLLACVSFAAGCSSSAVNDGKADAGSGGKSGSGGTGPATCDTSTHTCQPSPPDGWVPIHVFPGAGAAACSAPVKAGTDVTAEPSTCPACSCGTLENGVCDTSASVTYTQGASSCGSSPSCLEQFDASMVGSCQPIPVICSSPPAQPNGLSIPAVPVAGGNCAPDPVADPSFTTPSFVDPQALCEVDTFDGDCESEQTCFENPPAGAVPRYCVYRVTSEECPIAYPHERDSLYTDFDDTRSCSPCACDFAGLSCSVSVENFSDPGCPGSGTTKTYVPDQCFGITNWKSAKFTAIPPMGTACHATGGELTGSVVASKRAKVCCNLP